jgi:hypothetical protein
MNKLQNYIENFLFFFIPFKRKKDNLLMLPNEQTPELYQKFFIFLFLLKEKKTIY